MLGFPPATKRRNGILGHEWVSAWALVKKMVFAASTPRTSLGVPLVFAALVFLVSADAVVADEPCTALGCERVDCVDCAGLDCNSFRRFVGDGICDNGSYQEGGYHFDFMCADFNFDEGDCAQPATRAPTPTNGTSAAPLSFACTDCNGRNCTGRQANLGDGFCDAWFDFSFNCAEFNFDEGDCGNAQSSKLRCEDCNGIDCSYYEQYVADGYCDNGFSFHGHQMFDFNCPRHNMDGGDCDRTTTTTVAETLAPRRPQETVNCFGTWGSWSQCDMACSTGTHRRTFRVLQEATNGGIHCLFEDGQVYQAECNTHDCESTADNACPASCSTCYEVDSDKCYTGKGHDTEAECLAHGEDFKWCENPRDYCAGLWSTWSECDATCGGGEKSKVFRVEWPNSCGCDEFLQGATYTDARFCVNNENGALHCTPPTGSSRRSLLSSRRGGLSFRRSLGSKKADDDDDDDDDDDAPCPQGWDLCATDKSGSKDDDDDDDDDAGSSKKNSRQLSVESVSGGVLAHARLFERALLTRRSLSGNTLRRLGGKRDDDDTSKGKDKGDDKGKNDFDDDSGLDCISMDGRYIVVSCNIERCPTVVGDCDGNDASPHLSWVGDGVCDDGTQLTGYVLNFDCEEYSRDGGDCVPDCTDCSGNDCRGFRDRVGDGICDNNADSLNFYCYAWRFDRLDCENDEPCSDCDGNDCSAHTVFIGDGFCDEVGDGVNFDCEEFNYDEGDCFRDCDGSCGFGCEWGVQEWQLSLVTFVVPISAWYADRVNCVQWQENSSLDLKAMLEMVCVITDNLPMVVMWSISIVQNSTSTKETATRPSWTALVFGVVGEAARSLAPEGQTRAHTPFKFMPRVKELIVHIHTAEDKK